jgi:hypothetical protein
MSHDVLFLGNYTKDTIATPEATRTVHGGAFYYGANVACRLGLRTAAVTRLSREDFAVVEELTALGVSVRAQVTTSSTVLRLEYPDADPDHRRILVQSTAGSVLPRQVEGLEARLACIGASFRGEVGLEVLRLLAAQGADIALDVQGFVRVVREGRLSTTTGPVGRRSCPGPASSRPTLWRPPSSPEPTICKRPRGHCTSRDRGRSC